MRKLILSVLISFLGLAGMQAQEVFKQIRDNAEKSATEVGGNEMVKQINRFKVDALDYMLLKMREQMPDSTTQFLDKQAYAMNNFVNFYVKTILENRDLPQAMQVKTMKLFMDASVSNPLFNDTDEELTLSYYANGSCLTRFSLDTDWRKASAAIIIEMKKKQE